MTRMELRPPWRTGSMAPSPRQARPAIRPCETPWLTSLSVLRDESRFSLSGVLFAFQLKELRLVATDGHRLAVATRSVGKGLSGPTGILRARPWWRSPGSSG